MQELIAEAEFLENRKYFAMKRLKIEDLKRPRSTSSIKKREKEKQISQKFKLKAEGFFFDKISTSCSFSGEKGRSTDPRNSFTRQNDYASSILNEDIKNVITFGRSIPSKDGEGYAWANSDLFMRTHYNQNEGAESNGRRSENN